MADQIVATSGTLTITKDFDLDDGVLRKEIEVVHIPFTDFTFKRNQGKVLKPITAAGVETFDTLAEANSFKDRAESFFGLLCTITHDRLAPSGIKGRAIEVNIPKIDTNFCPGFHIAWSIVFNKFEGDD